MDKKSIFGGIVGAAIIIVGVMIFYNVVTMDDDDSNSNDNVVKEIQNVQGTFGINKDTYKLGETVFFVGTLAPDQQALIRVASPEGKIILEKYYNGIEREIVKFYFTPDTSSNKGIYTKDQLIGTWTMWFEGVNNNAIYFNIIDEFIPGAEKNIVDLRDPNDIEQEEQEQTNDPNMITVQGPPPP